MLFPDVFIPYEKKFAVVSPHVVNTTFQLVTSDIDGTIWDGWVAWSVGKSLFIFQLSD